MKFLMDIVIPDQEIITEAPEEFSAMPEILAAAVVIIAVVAVVLIIKAIKKKK